MKQLIATQIVNEKSPWDNVETKNRKESRSEILSKSFKEAIAVLETIRQISSRLEYKVHVVEYEHALKSGFA
jgi:penicillin amidase